jgi:hypothetical protein
MDREHTAGTSEKHRPKERCRILDGYDTIKMRKDGSHVAPANRYSLFIKFRGYIFLRWPSPISYPGSLTSSCSFPLKRMNVQQHIVILHNSIENMKKDYESA